LFHFRQSIEAPDLRRDRWLRGCCAPRHDSDSAAKLFEKIPSLLLSFYSRVGSDLDCKFRFHYSDQAPVIFDTLFQPRRFSASPDMFGLILPSCEPLPVDTVLIFGTHLPRRDNPFWNKARIQFAAMPDPFFDPERPLSETPATLDRFSSFSFLQLPTEN